MPQAVAVPSPVSSIDRLTLAVDAVRANVTAKYLGSTNPFTCFADDSE